MSRILLISANRAREPYPVYPLGLALVAGALAADGHLTEQFDLLAQGDSEELLAERVASFAPDYVLISVRNLDNCDSLNRASYPEGTRRLIDQLRELTGAPVIVGGSAFSIIPEELLSYFGADYGIVGEGERLVCRLVRDLEEGKRPERLQRGDGPIPGSGIGYPLHSKDLVDFYLSASGALNVQTKRGCPHGCAYCSYPALEGKRYRCRDPREVVEEMVRAQSEHGVKSFFITDSVFNDAEGQYLAVVEEMLRRGLDARWCCYLRPEGIGRREIKAMKRAGLYAAEMGTDASSDPTLAALGKGFGFDDVLKVHEACVAERLCTAHFVMFGVPGETMETVAEGLENLKRLDHAVVFAYSGVRVLPGTPLHERCVREGVVAADAPMREPLYYLSRQVDAQRMNDAIMASFRGRRDRIFPPSEGQVRLAILQNFGYRGLLWDSLIRFPEPKRPAGAAPPA